MRRRLAGGLAHGRPGDAPIHIGRARDKQVRPTAAGRQLTIKAVCNRGDVDKMPGAYAAAQ
nr:MAG TPA: hypothetical protein [Caudoviricetes sp.]